MEAPSHISIPVTVGLYTTGAHVQLSWSCIVGKVRSSIQWDYTYRNICNDFTLKALCMKALFEWHVLYIMGAHCALYWSKGQMWRRREREGHEDKDGTEREGKGLNRSMEKRERDRRVWRNESNIWNGLTNNACPLWTRSQTNTACQPKSGELRKHFVDGLPVPQSS